MRKLTRTACAVLLAVSATGLAHAQCMSGWTYYMPVTISNANPSTLTNYQVRLTVNTATPVGAGHMLASGNDIRFTDGSCNNIHYWIESGMNTATTYIWVKVPSLAASSNTTINMYYGNVAAPAASNGDSTFLFFDDFNDNSFNTSKWTVRGTPGGLTESGGIVNFYGSSNWEYFRSNTTFTGPVIIEDREMSTNVSAAMVLGYGGTDTRFTFREYSAGMKGTTYDPDVSGGNAWQLTNYPNVPHPTNVYHEYSLAPSLVGGVITLSSFCDVTASNCNTTSTALGYSGSSYYVGYSSYNSSYQINVDWIRVRSYAAQTPTSSNGSEIAVQGITTSTLGLTYCAGDVINIGFTANGSYNSGNVYSAELSDASGSFSAPTVIGTLASTSTGPLTINTIIPVATVSGTAYRIRVVASNPSTVGSDNGTNVSINAKPVVSITASDSVICIGETSVLTASPGMTSYNWSTGGINDNITVISGGTYAVFVADANGCMDTAYFTMQQNALPNVTASAASGTICAGSSDVLSASGGSSYSWSSGGTQATETVTPSATTTYTVTATDNNGCSNTATVTVNVNAVPVATATAASGTICAGSPDVLTASGGSSYSWSSGGNTATETVSPSVTTTYTVIVTDNNCSDTTTVTVNVNALPSVNLGGSQEQCGGSVTLDAGAGAAAYLWSDSSSAQTLTVSASGNYAVMVTDSNGCSASDTVAITIFTPPTAGGTASASTVCLNDGAVTLTGTPSGGTWSGPGVSGSSFNPAIAGNGAQTATYIFTDGNGCSDTATVIITVNPCTGITEQDPAAVFSLFPNPNNGTFTVMLNNRISDAGLSIYNALGQQVLNQTIRSNEQVTLNEAGMYTVVLTTADGARFQQRLIVR